MRNLLALSVIVLVTSLVHGRPAPPVTKLYFTGSIEKTTDGHTKFYYYQKGYDERVYVYYRGKEIGSDCKVHQTYTDFGGVITGWMHECLVEGTTGEVIIKTPQGNIYRKNYDKMNL